MFEIIGGFKWKSLPTQQLIEEALLLVTWQATPFIFTSLSALALPNPCPVMVITVHVPGGPPWPYDGLIDVILGVIESVYA